MSMQTHAYTLLVGFSASDLLGEQARAQLLEDLQAAESAQQWAAVLDSLERLAAHWLGTALEDPERRKRREQILCCRTLAQVGWRYEGSQFNPLAAKCAHGFFWHEDQSCWLLAGCIHCT